jgi:hypothetical protein
MVLVDAKCSQWLGDRFTYAESRIERSEGILKDDLDFTPKVEKGTPLGWQCCLTVADLSMVGDLESDK